MLNKVVPLLNTIYIVDLYQGSRDLMLYSKSKNISLLIVYLLHFGLHMAKLFFLQFPVQFFLLIMC